MGKIFTIKDVDLRNTLKKGTWYMSAVAEFTPGPEDGTGVKSDFAFIYPGRDTGFYLFPFASGLIYEW